MQTMDFKKSVELAHNREALIGSALARHFNSSICFIEDSEKRRDYDFCLYSSRNGWASKIEMQDDYYITSMDQTLCVELFSYTKKDSKQKIHGKLYYTKADKLLFVLNNLKKIILLDVKVIKDFIILLEETGQLILYEPKDHKAWHDRHDTMPTSCALLPIQECLLQDPKSCVLSFEQLSISKHYDKFKFTRDSDD